MGLEQPASAMRPTPHQTYLAERLQSAKGIGWDCDQPGSAWVGLPFLLRWLRVIR
jgi:hypothetical protein